MESKEINQKRFSDVVGGIKDWLDSLTPQEKEDKAEEVAEQEGMLKEMAYQHSKSIIDNLGYNTIQEGIVDLMIEGYYNKEEGEWVEITDPSDIQTNRNHINLAQAKFYELIIIRTGTEDWKKRQ